MKYRHLLLSSFLAVLAIAPLSGQEEPPKQRLLAIAPFDPATLPRNLGRNYSATSLNNDLSAASSLGIVFKPLLGLEYLRGAITLDPELGRRAYQEKNAEFLLLNCAVSVKPDGAYTVSASLVEIVEEEGEITLERIAGISAEAVNIEQLMAQFWMAIDRPLEIIGGVPNLRGRWRAEKAGADEYIRHGDTYVLKTPRIIVNQRLEQITAFHEVVNGWVTAGQKTTMPGLTATWNPSGFFAGHYTHDISGSILQPVKAKVRYDASGARFLELTVSETRRGEMTFPGGIDRWEFETPQLGSRDGFWRAGYPKDGGGLDASYDIEIQQNGDRLTVLPMGESAAPWSKIEGFLDSDTIYLYFFKATRDRNHRIQYQLTRRDKARLLDKGLQLPAGMEIHLSDEVWKFHFTLR